MEKVNSPLDFPETLDLAPFVETESERDEARDRDGRRRTEEGEEAPVWPGEDLDGDEDAESGTKRVKGSPL